MVNHPPANAGDTRDTDWVPGLGSSPAGGNGNPLQYSCLENAMDKGAWQATVHRVAKNQTQLKQLPVHACCKMAAHQCNFHPDDLKYLLLIEGAIPLKLGQYITTYEHLSMHFFGNLILYMSTFYG